MNILGDNEMSFTLTKDPQSQNWIKQINVIYQHVRGLVEKKELLVEWILSAKMLANSLIKILPAGLFRKYWDQ